MSRGSAGAMHVAEFIENARSVAKRSEGRVNDLARSCEAAARRAQELRDDLRRRVGGDGAADILFQEVAVRDEELAVACEELRRQLAELGRAHTMLSRERAKYLDLFENAPDAYVVTDLHGIVQDANHCAGTLFGVQPRFLIHRPLIGFVARADTMRFRSDLNALAVSAGSEGEPRALKLRLRPRGQAVLDALLHVTCIRPSPGAPAIALRSIVRRDEPEAR